MRGQQQVMSKIPKPEAKNATPQSERILQMMREKGEWLSRAEIAALTGKKRLNVWDMALLDMMVEQGLLMLEKREITGGIGFAWVYKAVDKGSE
jgi:hypothetical protein